MALEDRGGVAPSQPQFPVELLTPGEMAQADRLAAAATPSMTLMETAGGAVAEVALGRGASRAVVLCGPGNNGGDGYVVARRLRERGVDVMVGSSVDRSELTGDAAEAARRCGGDALPLRGVELDRVGLVVDALFGAGLRRPLDDEASAVVERVNGWRRAGGGRVLAIDIPSGIDGATGRSEGPAIEADDTVTFFRLKPGHLLLPGRLHCGRLHLAEIGIAPGVLADIAPRTFLNVPPLWRKEMPVPSLAGHKYARGHAVIVSGPVSQTGAARLAARGALRAGAGLVTVATPAAALLVHAASLTAIMTRVVDGAAALAELLADSRRNAVAMGPGLGVGAATRELVLAALAREAGEGLPPSLVLDADALTSFAEAPHLLFSAIAASGQRVVLTPHDGEFARLFADLVDAGAGKPERARAAATLAGAAVVLKGPDTVVAHPDGRAGIAMSDAPCLATAGSGDVLAGMVAGLLAQGMELFAAASAAVWMHAEAARRFGPGLISEDLPDALPPVLRNLAGAA